MDLETMTIAEHEAEINRLSDQGALLRVAMKVQHDAMEQKIKRSPIAATPLDQTIGLGGADIVSQLKALPPAILEQVRAFFKGEN